MTDCKGYQERNRGGRYLRDNLGEKVLYDHKNNLLNKTDAVWVVTSQTGFPKRPEYPSELHSIWYDYDLAFDHAEKIGGYLDRWVVRRK